MFGILPVQWQNWNQNVTTDDVPTSFVRPICTVVCGGNNLWRGFKEPIYFGISDDGYFQAFVPQNDAWPKGGPTVGMEAFDTPGWIQGVEMIKGWTEGPREINYECVLDWCTFNSSEQAYWNLGPENRWSGPISVQYPEIPM